jgi:sister-chromatid-cohesion protein PDS5
VTQTRHAAVPSLKKLAFKDKLVGKGVSTDLTIKKLQALHRELADLEQELVEVQTDLEGLVKANVSIIFPPDYPF